MRTNMRRTNAHNKCAHKMHTQIHYNISQKTAHQHMRSQHVHTHVHKQCTQQNNAHKNAHNKLTHNICTQNTRNTCALKCAQHTRTKHVHIKCAQNAQTYAHTQYAYKTLIHFMHTGLRTQTVHINAHNTCAHKSANTCAQQMRTRHALNKYIQTCTNMRTRQAQHTYKTCAQNMRTQNAHNK